MKIEDVNKLANSLIRKYDWHTEQLGYGVKVVVTDGEKKASVAITSGENAEAEIKRLITAVDNHEYKEME